MNTKIEESQPETFSEFIFLPKNRFMKFQAQLIDHTKHVIHVVINNHRENSAENVEQNYKLIKYHIYFFFTSVIMNLVFLA